MNESFEHRTFASKAISRGAGRSADGNVADNDWNSTFGFL